LSSGRDERIFLLEVRKQLKNSHKNFEKIDYIDFIKVVDNLYLLAVDKQLSFGEKLVSETSSNNDPEENPARSMTRNLVSRFIRQRNMMRQTP
jgi:hypothetical protein